MPKFEDIQIGDSASLEKNIQEEDIKTFAKLTGDRNPIHMDQSFAENSKFGARVSHGMLTSSFISTLIGMDLPGEGSILTNISLDFKKPVFIGDTLLASIEVTKKVLLTKQVFFKILISSQHSIIVASGTAKSICPK